MKIMNRPARATITICCGFGSEEAAGDLTRKATSVANVHVQNRKTHSKKLKKNYGVQDHQYINNDNTIHSLYDSWHQHTVRSLEIIRYHFTKNIYKDLQGQ